MTFNCFTMLPKILGLMKIIQCFCKMKRVVCTQVFDSSIYERFSSNMLAIPFCCERYQFISKRFKSINYFIRLFKLKKNFHELVHSILQSLYVVKRSLIE